VQATIKHFIANEQEHFRGDGQVTNTISSNVDDRTMHEAYLWAFSEGVRAGVASVMCSYNMVSKIRNQQIEHFLIKQLDKRILRLPEQQTSQWNPEGRARFPRLRHGWYGPNSYQTIIDTANITNQIGSHNAVVSAPLLPEWTKPSLVMDPDGPTVSPCGGLSCPGPSSTDPSQSTASTML
jgi:hypothetical protein